MKGEAMAFCQIAAGSIGRDYSNLFIRHGLAFVGGDLQCNVMGEVQPNDVVILKRGMTEIVAVGQVVERGGLCRGINDKSWLRDFDGWDLPAWCNVDWRVPPNPVVTQGLTRATIQRVGAQHLIELAHNILDNFPALNEYEPEPTATETVTDDDLIGHLVQFGLRPGAAEDLTQAMRRIRLLARFYRERDWNLTKEHEARSFLVVPLLLALGWAEQRIRIELNVPGVGRADIACFRNPVKTQDQYNDCVLLIETKGLMQGLDYAPKQAHRYAKMFPSCNVVLVTNGYCYKAYKRGNGNFSLHPSAYLNIINPQDKYHIDTNVGGAIEILKMLIPR